MGGFNKQYLSSAILLIIANLTTLISMFLEWTSGQSPFELLISDIALVTNQYLYAFPIISALLGVTIALVLLFRSKSSNSLGALGIFISAGFQGTFLIEMLSTHGYFLLGYAGFFVGIGGFGLSFFTIFWLLNQNDE